MSRFHRKAFRATILLACFRGLSVKNISNSLTYSVASSCVCTSPLAVMIIVGLRDFVKVSISASLKSFLLIICIDAPESTTISRSWGSRVDGAGRHLFSEGEKNVALSCSFNLNTFLASFHTASRAPCSCHSVSSCERSSNFGALGLLWWGSLGANHSQQRILVSNFSVTCNSFREFHSLAWFLQFWDLPENRVRRLHVLKYTTQLSCVRWSTSSRSSFQLMITILVRSPRSVVTFVKADNRLPCSIMQVILLQHGYCTLVSILSGPFTRLFIDLTVRTRALCPQICNHSWSCRTSILEGATFHKMSYCKFLWGNPCKAIETFYHWDSCLWDFGFSTHIVSFWTLPVVFPLPTISKNSLSSLFHLLILDHSVNFIISISGATNPVS